MIPDAIVRSAHAASDGAPVRLVCIDVDGTLVGAGGTVHPAVWPAAQRLRAAGVRLAICSGRPGFGAARGYADRLDADGWHIFQNGASIVHLGTRESRSVALPVGAAEALVARARASGRTLELYADDGYAVAQGPADGGDRARRHAALLGVPYAPQSLDAFVRAHAGRAVRAQWLLAHDDAPAVLAEPLDGARLVPSSSPVMADTTFVSVLAPGIDKVVAVRAVAAAYGLPLSAVMFVGDGANDADAMSAVGAAGGRAVAMANAEPEALAVATRVVAHVDAGGLADALAEALTRTVDAA